MLMMMMVVVVMVSYTMVYCTYSSYIRQEDNRYELIGIFHIGAATGRPHSFPYSLMF